MTHVLREQNQAIDLFSFGFSAGRNDGSSKMARCVSGRLRREIERRRRDFCEDVGYVVLSVWWEL